MPFLTSVVAEDRGDGRWLLAADLIYRGKSEDFVVPSGFPTDFASVPRLLQWVAPKLGRQNRSAVLHDYLYAVAPLVLTKGGWMQITRKDADGLFRRTMREDRVSWLRRWTFYLAVRVGGWLPWYQSRRNR